MLIRPAATVDHDAIWAILEPVIRAGETFALDRDMSRETALAFWLANEAFVAEDCGAVVGTYYLRRNQAGGGGHVCNCGYMVDARATGRGVARAMCEHSLAHARDRGYRGMQFQFRGQRQRARGAAVAGDGVRRDWPRARRVRPPAARLRRCAGDVPPALGLPHAQHVAFGIGEVPPAPRPMEDRRARRRQALARRGGVFDCEDQLAAFGLARSGRSLGAEVRGNRVERETRVAGVELDPIVEARLPRPA
jgi:GNAT superfamily N-acetyltransferase